jgi:hypothetical protein
MKGKRRHPASVKTRRAARKAPRAKNKALNVARDATLNQELLNGQNRLTRGRRSGAGPLSNGFDVLALLTRRSRAALELPTRLARCHSPFEFWSAQAQFMQGGFADCTVALRMTVNGLQ